MESHRSYIRSGIAGHPVLKAGEDRRKAYRRKGYRVRIEVWHRDQLRWAVYRPRMRTPAATGVTLSVEAAIAGANAWIAGDDHGLRVT